MSSAVILEPYILDVQSNPLFTLWKRHKKTEENDLIKELVFHDSYTATNRRDGFWWNKSDQEPTSSSSSNTDEDMKSNYDFEVILSKDTSASDDESADSEPEEVFTPRTVTSVNVIDMTTDPVTVSINLPKKLVEDALNEDTTETFHITLQQTDPMTIVEFSDTDKLNYSTSSSSSNSDNEDPEAVLLPVSIEETVKTATIETVESVPLDEDTNNSISKPPFFTDPLIAKEYTCLLYTSPSPRDRG